MAKPWKLGSQKQSDVGFQPNSNKPSDDTNAKFSITLTFPRTASISGNREICSMVDVQSTWSFLRVKFKKNPLKSRYLFLKSLLTYKVFWYCQLWNTSGNSLESRLSSSLFFLHNQTPARTNESLSYLQWITVWRVFSIHCCEARRYFVLRPLLIQITYVWLNNRH